MDGLHELLLEHLFDGVYFVDRSKKITFWNRAAEAITGYSREEVKGRVCSDRILEHVDLNGAPLCQGKCPLSATLTDGCTREADVYLHRKDGVRLPVSVRVAPVFGQSGDLIGGLVVFSDSSEKLCLLRRMEDVKRQSLTDPLTGAANRRQAIMVLEGRLNELNDLKTPFGVLMADLDHFKRVNDKFGHPTGDRLLQAIVGTMRNCLRTVDCLARWGGEEFLIIVSGTTERGMASLAERLARMVEGTWVATGGDTVNATVSIGGVFVAFPAPLDAILSTADYNLYHCKDAGRNRNLISVIRRQDAAMSSAS